MGSGFVQMYRGMKPIKTVFSWENIILRLRRLVVQMVQHRGQPPARHYGLWVCNQGVLTYGKHLVLSRWLRVLASLALKSHASIYHIFSSYYIDLSTAYIPGTLWRHRLTSPAVQYNLISMCYNPWYLFSVLVFRMSVWGGGQRVNGQKPDIKFDFRPDTVSKRPDIRPIPN